MRPVNPDAIAHDLIKCAFNIDRLGALLKALEKDEPGTVAALAQQLAHLGISNTKLSEMKRRGGLVKGRHWTRKDPTLARSDSLWHGQRCDMGLGRI